MTTMVVELKKKKKKEKKRKTNRDIDLLEVAAEETVVSAFLKVPLFVKFVNEWKEHPSVRLPDCRLPSARLYLKLEVPSGF